LAILENTYCGVTVTSYTPNPCPSHPGLGALLVNGPYANPVGSPSSGPPTIQSVDDGTGLTANVPFATISRQVPEPANTWETSGRVDYQVTSKDRIFGRYIFQDNTFNGGAGRFAAGAWVDEPSRSQNAGVDWVRNWTSNFVNQVRFNYSRLFVDFGGAAGTPFASCDVPTILSCPTGITMFDNTTAFGYQNNLPQDRLVNDSELQDNATWVHGKHTVKFGGEYERQRSPNNFLPNINGTVLYRNFGRLLSNRPTQISLTRGVLRLNFKEQDAGIYAQDDWRIRENLTLNLGIRWEFTQQAINLLHDLTVARESDPATAFWDTTLPIEARTVPHIPQDTNNWGPNIGFAWTPRIWK